MGFAEQLAAADARALETLGEAVTYTPGTGSPVSVQGIFDATYVRVDLGQPGVSSQGPAVFLSLVDLPSDPETDTTATVTIAGVTYTPHEVQPDGKGGVVLHLHRTS